MKKFNLEYIPKCGSSIFYEHMPSIFEYKIEKDKTNSVLILRDPFDRAITELISILSKGDKIYDITFEDMLFDQKNVISKYLKLDEVLDINLDLKDNEVISEPIKNKMKDYLGTYNFIGLYNTYFWAKDKLYRNKNIDIRKSFYFFCKINNISAEKIPIENLDEKINYINLYLGLRGKFNAYNKLDIMLTSCAEMILGEFTMKGDIHTWID